MLSHRFRLPGLSSVLLFLALSLSAQETVRLSADSWMPYNGSPEDEQPGYVVEFAKEIFAEAGVQVEYVTMPWEQALDAAKTGEVDGAICANRQEGAELVITGEPVGAPKMIIVTRPDADWTFRNIGALRQISQAASKARRSISNG